MAAQYLGAPAGPGLCRPAGHPGGRSVLRRGGDVREDERHDGAV